MTAPRSLVSHPIHLGRGATAVPQPEFTGYEWYQAYGERHADDGTEGRLVAIHAFAGDWTSWEMHPHGAEVVVCLSGEITLHQEFPEGGSASVTLTPHRYAVNPPGTWHTADVANEATALFITAGAGTEVRPR